MPTTPGFDTNNFYIICLKDSLHLPITDNSDNIDKGFNISINMNDINNLNKKNDIYIF